MKLCGVSQHAELHNHKIETIDKRTLVSAAGKKPKLKLIIDMQEEWRKPQEFMGIEGVEGEILAPVK